MVSKFYYFSLTVMKLIVAKNQALSQLPDCQNAARKSFFYAIFTDFTSKSFLSSNWAIIQLYDC